MEDLSNIKFNRLKVISFNEKRNRRFFWNCLCECGNIVSKRSDSLKNGHTKSCGCIRNPNELQFNEILEQRLLKNSVKQNGCWEWKGHKIWSGYGLMSYKEGSKAVHRVAYTVWKGDIPKGKYVLHKCDNRACINPDHLFLGTHLDNMNDMKEKNRQDKRPGELHHVNKMKNEDILEIRKLWDLGKETQAGLARKYKVSVSCIHNIVRRKAWNHI